LSRFVLDNTVTMAWCFTGEATDFTETLLNRLSDLTDTALVPALWLYEVVNVVELAVRKGRITKDKAFDFLQSLAELPIEVEDLSRTEVFVSSCATRSYTASAGDGVMGKLAMVSDLEPHNAALAALAAK
jgi:predicted nucleic acid-binding protein